MFTLGLTILLLSMVLVAYQWGCVMVGVLLHQLGLHQKV
ncbi:transporter GltP [Vibrio parahaemolyticus K5030]|nr:transporter GltP [Vibrio parahaemolyticus K5030]